MKPFYTDWDEFKDGQLCNAWVAAAIIGSSVLGAGASIFGAKKAADAQKDAAYLAASTQMNMYNTTRRDLMAYRGVGDDAATRLTANDYYTAPIDVSAELANPDSVARKAYDFTLTQGNKAVSNAAAARGLGVSGAALKGAAAFTTGLADNTYKTVFDIANTNKTNAFNRLKAVMDTGANAAAMTGNAGVAAAKGTSDAFIGAGNATAAAANATGGAIANLSNNIGGYYAYRGLYGGGNQNTSIPNNGSGIYSGDPTIPGFG